MYMIFDMDGVILDSERVYRDACLYAVEVLSLPKDKVLEAASACTGCTPEAEKEIVEGILGHVPGFSYESFYGTTRQYFDNIFRSGKLQLKPGARELLEYLKARRIPLGLASSSPKEVIEKELGQLGILSYFDTVTSGDMVTKSKPDPEIFLRCAKALKIPPCRFSETYVIEDSHKGIQAAYAAGMRPVMIPDCMPVTPEIKEQAYMVYNSLFELKEWIHLTGRDPYFFHCLTT